MMFDVVVDSCEVDIMENDHWNFLDRVKSCIESLNCTGFVEEHL